MTSSLLLETPLANMAHRGKVRDLYDLGDRLLIVATDRISAFDVVLPSGIPGKGAVLARGRAAVHAAAGAHRSHSIVRKAERLSVGHMGSLTAAPEP